MKVIIPLAGFGTRLRPHTFTKPKPLINVAGKAVLGHLLDKLAPLDVEEYIFIVGYLGDQVEAYVRANYPIKARFVEQTEMLGQAHAIYLAKEHLQADTPVFVIFVDTLFEADLSNLQQDGSDALIFVKEVDDPRPFGVVTLNERGEITRFIEKPATTENKLVVVGLYYFARSLPLLAAIEQLMARGIMTKNEYFLADAMQLMVQDGMKFHTRQVSEWLDCGRAETVLATNRYLLEHGHDNSAQLTHYTQTIIIPPVHIDPSARIVRSVVGPHVTIAANAVIEDCLVRDSIIDEGAFCKDTLLAQSLVGRNARVEGRFRAVNVGDSSVLGFA
ncbi:MAG: NTP transferase domain-containing protein [Chloroflexi bacterium]|jgi:glucose-1-phosphate thymidylyltransferase|nr:NTP transferase domain-containing protein [Chloroflexota bacterium]